MKRQRAVLHALSARGPLTAAELVADPAVGGADGRDVSLLLWRLRDARLVRIDDRRRRRYVWAVTDLGREKAEQPDAEKPIAPRFGVRQEEVLVALRGGVRAAWAPDHRERHCRAWVVIRSGEVLDGRVVRSLRRRGLVAEVRRHERWHEYALTAEGEAVAARLAGASP
jgi:hypothetical protein